MARKGPLRWAQYQSSSRQTLIRSSPDCSRSSRKFLSCSRCFQSPLPRTLFKCPDPQLLYIPSPTISIPPSSCSPSCFEDPRSRMDYGRLFGLNDPLMSTLQHMMDIPEEVEKAFNAPTRTYVRDAKAMASTPADVKELPSSYVFVIDMPGVKSGEIKVQVEDDSMLVVSGERKREEDKEGKFVRMERRMGKFMRKFSLPENANTDAISAVCQDGVLTVAVQKKPPPEPKKPKTVEVKVA